MTRGIEIGLTAEKEITGIHEVEKDCLRTTGKKTEIDIENQGIPMMKKKITVTAVDLAGRHPEIGGPISDGGEMKGIMAL